MKAETGNHLERAVDVIGVLYGTARMVEDLGVQCGGANRAYLYAINPPKVMRSIDGYERRSASFVTVHVEEHGPALAQRRTSILPAFDPGLSRRTGATMPKLDTMRSEFVVHDDDVAGAFALMDYDVDSSAQTGGPPDPALVLLSEVRRAVKFTCDEAALLSDAARTNAQRVALSIEQRAIDCYRRLVAGAS